MLMFKALTKQHKANLAVMRTYKNNVTALQLPYGLRRFTTADNNNLTEK